MLVERAGQRRSITPIIKPPRQRHLQLNQEYPATLATLYPEQVPAETEAEAPSVSSTQIVPDRRALAARCDLPAPAWPVRMNMLPVES